MAVDYKKLTLESIVYHPLFGKGEVRSVGLNTPVEVFFYGKTKHSAFILSFKHNGYSETDHIVEHLYSFPVKVVEDEKM